MDLQGKKALVTGASRGIGRAITEKFLAAGAEIWGLGNAEPPDLAAWIEAARGKFHWKNLDLGNFGEVEAAVEALIAEAGGFDVLVNNAGITKDNLSFRMSLEDFQKVLDINLTASFLVARTVGKDMIHRRRGSIINMASVVGIHGNGGQANYAASKAGLIGLTKSLARETAGRGVRVNALAPGFIDSDMTAVLPDAVKEAMLAQIPLRRMGRPEEVANAALFLASDAAAYLTGIVLPVDGGMFM